MFSMASMTDVIFLLLIFFMVTSTFVFPSAMEVNLPQSSQQTAIKPSTRIYIDKDSHIFATQILPDSTAETAPAPLQADQVEGFLLSVKQGDPSQFVALYADEAVPYGQVVNILEKGSKVGVKVVLATKPAQNTVGSGQQATSSQQPSAEQAAQ